MEASCFQGLAKLPVMLQGEMLAHFPFLLPAAQDELNLLPFFITEILLVNNNFSTVDGIIKCSSHL